MARYANAILFLKPYPLSCPCIRSLEPHGQVVDFFKVFNFQYDKVGKKVYSVKEKDVLVT